MSITITPASLQKSATQYRRQLLIMPVIAAQATLQHMRGIFNLKGNVMLGQMDGDAELGPWKATRGEDADFKITGRELVMNLGNCAKNFSPQEVWGSIYGSEVLKGEALKNVDINKAVLSLVAGKLGKKLNMAVWKAKRNPSGDNTTDLFDGFDTITEAEITAGNIAEDKNNLVKVEAVTENNAVDILHNIYDAMSDELKEQAVKCYMPVSVYNSYCRDYRDRFGALPYNTKYKKLYLDGSNDLFELCPLASKKGSKYIHIAPQSNMVYGSGSGKYPGETLSVEKYSSWKLTLEAAMAFGCQFESISPEMLLVAEIGTASAGV